MTDKEIKEYAKKHEKEMCEHALMLGNPQGRKIVYVFSDYTCPYCVAAHRKYVSAIEKDSQLCVVIKNFPIHGQVSEIPARALIAANIQDSAKAAKLDKSLMADHSWMEGKVLKNIIDLAKNAGLDVIKLQADMESKVVNKELAHVQELVQKFGIGGTPFIVAINK